MKKFSKILLLVFLFIFILPVFSSCNNLDKTSKDLTTYSLNLEFEASTNILKGKQEVDYINNTSDPLDFVEFHLYPNAFRKDAKFTPVTTSNFNRAYPNKFSEGKIEIKSVKNEGAEKEIDVCGNDKNILKVNLNEKLYPTNKTKIEIEYEVTLPNCLHRFGYNDNAYNFGNFYPIASVYENGSFREDNYGPNGDPFYSEMANYNVTLVYDKNLILACTGEEVKLEENDNKKTSYIEAKVVRDFAFVLGKNFKVATKMAGNTKVFYYYYNDDNFEKSLNAGVDAINTFSKLFGEYPYSTYSVVKTGFVHGGMEYPNLVYISDAVADYDEYLNVIIHETAHQWWYNLVGSNACQWAWMDEGLTEYSTLMFYRNCKGYNINVDESLRASLSSYIIFSEIYDSIYHKFDGTMSRNLMDFDGEMDYVYNTYVKGVLFFDNLEQTIGSKKFLKGLRTYFKNNLYKIATPSDMISAFEMATKTNMEGFFKSWIEGKVVLKSK